MTSPTFPDFDLCPRDLPGQVVFSSGERNPGPLTHYCQHCNRITDGQAFCLECERETETNPL